VSGNSEKRALTLKGTRAGVRRKLIKINRAIDFELPGILTARLSANIDLD